MKQLIFGGKVVFVKIVPWAWFSFKSFYSQIEPFKGSILGKYFSCTFWPNGKFNSLQRIIKLVSKNCNFRAILQRSKYVFL